MRLRWPHFSSFYFFLQWFGANHSLLRHRELAFTAAEADADMCSHQQCGTTSVIDVDLGPTCTACEDGFTFDESHRCAQYEVSEKIRKVGSTEEGDCSAFTTKLFNVQDNSGPECSSPPQTETVTLDASTCIWTYTPGVTATFDDNCDGVITGVPFNVPVGGFLFEGCITETFSASKQDECGNDSSSACELTVTAVDNTNPTCTVAGTTTYYADSNCQAIIGQGTATGSDNCGVAGTELKEGINLNIDLTDPGVTFQFCRADVTVTHVVTDVCGNLGECDLQVEVIDNSGPQCISTPTPVVPLSYESGTCTKTYQHVPLAQFSDNCEGLLTASYSEVSFLHVQGDNNGDGVPDYCSQTKQATAVKSDSCANSDATCYLDVIVTDSEGPTCDEDKTDEVDLDDSCTYIYDPSTSGITASFSDNCDGSISGVAFSGEEYLFESCGESKTFEGSTQDLCGNDSNACTLTVTARDNIAPECAQNTPYEDSTTLDGNCQATDFTSAVQASFSDNCAEIADVSFPSVTITGGVGSLANGLPDWCSGSASTSVTENDGCGGNEATCNLVVSATDATAPTCVLNGQPLAPGTVVESDIPADATSCSLTVTALDVKGSDNCRSGEWDAELTTTDLEVDVTGQCSVDLPIDYIVDDQCGNVGTCSYTARVNANAPEFDNCPTDGPTTTTHCAIIEAEGWAAFLPDIQKKDVCNVGTLTPPTPPPFPPTCSDPTTTYDFEWQLDSACDEADSSTCTVSYELEACSGQTARGFEPVNQHGILKNGNCGNQWGWVTYIETAPAGFLVQHDLWAGMGCKTEGQCGAFVGNVEVNPFTPTSTWNYCQLDILVGVNTEHWAAFVPASKEECQELSAPGQFNKDGQQNGCVEGQPCCVATHVELDFVAPCLGSAEYQESLCAGVTRFHDPQAGGDMSGRCD